jgi:hypothetical protein
MSPSPTISPSNKHSSLPITSFSPHSLTSTRSQFHQSISNSRMDWHLPDPVVFAVRYIRHDPSLTSEVHSVNLSALSRVLERESAMRVALESKSGNIPPFKREADCEHRFLPVLNQTKSWLKELSVSVHSLELRMLDSVISTLTCAIAHVQAHPDASCDSRSLIHD